MYIDNENFEKWMEKLSKKLTEIGQDLKSLINTDTVFDENEKLLDNQDLAFLLKASFRTLRDMLFRTERSSHTGITRQYIQGDTSRLGQTDSYFRQSGPLGGSGSIFHELCPYGTRPRNRFAPQHGLGNFHRCGNQEIK